MIRKSTFETAICDLFVDSYMAGSRGSVEQWNIARGTRTKFFAMLDELFKDIEKLTEERDELFEDIERMTEERDDWHREAETNGKEF